MNFRDPQIGEISIGEPFGKTRKVPCYSCGHCSRVVVMRPNRTRERKRCSSCGKLICEKTDICSNHCTPIHEMARDHFENAGDRAMYVPAIMAGVKTRNKAHERGLIKEK